MDGESLRRAASNLTEPLRILLVSGSPRAAGNCPKERGKSARICDLLLGRPPAGVEYDFLDLAVRSPGEGSKVQPCKACVSTSMAHCHWPCSCYSPEFNDSEPDLLWDEDVYGRLERAHGIAVVTPVNWYSGTSQLKAMFDRIVCANGGNPYPELTDWKDRALSRRLEVLPEWRVLRRNHLAGRTACFLVYGDGGADEIGPDGYPSFLRPEDRDYDLTEEAAWSDPRAAVMPLVMQLRYSGIHVAPEHVRGLTFGQGMPYGLNNVTFHLQDDVLQEALDLMEGFARATSERLLKVSRSMPEEERRRDAERLDLAALRRKVRATDYPD